MKGNEREWKDMKGKCKEMTENERKRKGNDETWK